MKKGIKSIVVLFTLIIILSSCTTVETPKKTNDLIEQHSTETLPPTFTIQKIQDAFVEFINYRLWMYPNLYYSTQDLPFQFEPYIHQKIDIEIRIYPFMLNDHTVYIHTNISDALFLMEEKNGYVYCDDWVIDNSNEKYPKGDYVELVKYSYEIPEAQKPNYGNSPRKMEMLDVIEKEVNRFCEQVAEDQEHRKMEVYITDFFEYEEYLSIYLFLDDQTFIESSIHIDEYKEGLKAEVGNFIIIKEGPSDRDDWIRFERERNLDEAIRHYTYTSN